MEFIRPKFEIVTCSKCSKTYVVLFVFSKIGISFCSKFSTGFYNLLVRVTLAIILLSDLNGSRAAGPTYGRQEPPGSKPPESHWETPGATGKPPREPCTESHRNREPPEATIREPPESHRKPSRKVVPDVASSGSHWELPSGFPVAVPGGFPVASGGSQRLSSGFWWFPVACQWLPWSSRQQWFALRQLPVVPGVAFWWLLVVPSGLLVASCGSQRPYAAPAALWTMY